MRDNARASDMVSVRPAARGDAEGIRALALGNGMFQPDDMDAFDAALNGYLDGSMLDHMWVVAIDGAGRLIGAAYFAPEPFGDRVWNLYFLAVGQGEHGRGTGSALVAHVEQTLRARGESAARVMIVETSSGRAYEDAREFYAHRGFHREAVIREFYGPTEDKIVFWKSVV